MVAQARKPTKKGREKAFAKGLIEGKSQRQAYQDAFNCAPSTAGSKSSQMANRPAVIELVDRGLALIKEKDAKDVVSGVVKMAKGAKKTVFVGRERHSVEDNGTTLAAADRFFQLAGHPAFSKGVTVNVDARQTAGSDEVIAKMSGMLDRLEEMTTRMSGASVEKPTDFIDVDYEPTT